MNYKHSIAIILLVGSAMVSEAQTNFYLSGLGRALVANDKLSGDVLQNDSLSPRRGAGGYALFDLKANLDVKKNFKGNAILRVRNEFGTFWGRGAALEFRQLQLKGLIGNGIQYEIGDINVGMTPYTVYNSDEIYHRFESAIHDSRRKILEYENFNFGNDWRLQGAQANTSLLFKKGIQKLSIKGFATRTNATNEINIPDRVLAGGSVYVVQSKFFEIGGNYVGLLDIPIQTAQINYQNNVLTGNTKLKYDKEKISLSINGETGFSNYKYEENITQISVSSYNDFFYDLGLSGNYKPAGIKLSASYKDVGPQFSSPAAQTTRLNVSRTPLLYSTLQNNTVNRQQLLFDRFTQEKLYNRSISPVLLAYFPEYNNSSPYGAATPNRKGTSFTSSIGASDKVVEAEVLVDLLSEVAGEGTPERRKFTVIRGGSLFHLSKLIKFKKDLSFNFGFRTEQTKRNGQATVNLQSTLIDAGSSIEFVNKVDLLIGVKLLQASGNEYLAVRDQFNVPTSFPAYIINKTEYIYSGGLRVRFSEGSSFSVNYNVCDYKNKISSAMSYRMNQLFVNYTVSF
jgi:hypothetical protein